MTLFTRFVFLEESKINNRKDAEGVENEDGDKPDWLIVSSRFPEADGFPDYFPES